MTPARLHRGPAPAPALSAGPAPGPAPALALVSSAAPAPAPALALLPGQNPGPQTFLFNNLNFSGSRRLRLLFLWARNSTKSLNFHSRNTPKHFLKFQRSPPNTLGDPPDIPRHSPWPPKRRRRRRRPTATTSDEHIRGKSIFLFPESPAPSKLMARWH